MTDRPTLISQLTSLRFFAAAAVVLLHSGTGYAKDVLHLPDLIVHFMQNGFTGVTFFFVLSGFILQYVYASKINDRSDLKRYLIARFARIYPIYFLALIAMIPFSTSNFWYDVPQFFLLHHWLPTSVILFSYWNAPAWTLSVELFFYLLFPLITRGATALGTSLLVAIILLLALFIILTGSSAIVLSADAGLSWMNYIPVPVLRLPEFLIGVGIGELHRRKLGLPAWLPAWVVAGGLLVAMATTSGATAASAVTLFSAVLIFVLARRPDDWLGRGLNWRPIVLLGGASYSLYMLHQPIHSAFAAISGGNKAVVALQYPAVIVGSLFAFAWVEEPMRERIRRWADLGPSANLAILWSTLGRRTFAPADRIEQPVSEKEG